MSEIKNFTPVKLVVCILISNLSYKNGLLSQLRETFGEMDYESELFLFTFTTYYDEEMGTPIYRFFVSFKKLVDPSLIPNIKITTNNIEARFLENDKRKINIDPGFLFLSRFVLASTKDGSYRIPLHSGIYGEITLVYVKNNFRDVELTYPDFKSEKYKSILIKIRQIYKQQLQS
jgi:hypothetical protein